MDINTAEKEEDGRPKKKFTTRIVFVLAGGFLMHIALGQSYTVGNFAPYFISYIKNRTDDTDVENVDILWFSAASSSVDWLGLICGSLLERVLGPRITILIASAVFGGSMALNYFLVKVSYVVFLISYGTINSIAGVLVYGLSIQTAVQWFPHRPSMASGIVLSGYGAGALVFNQIMTQFINPDNLAPDLIIDNDRYFTDPDLLDRVPYCFALLGGLYFVMIAVGSLGMVVPPTDKRQDITVMSENGSGQTSVTAISVSTSVDITSATEMGESNRQDISSHISSHTSVQQLGTTDLKPESTAKIDLSTASLKTVLKVVLRTRSFYIVWFQVLFAVWPFLFIAFLYKAYGQTFIVDDHFLALTGTLSSIFNSVGRPIWGFIMDKFGYKVTIRCITVGFTVFCATLFLTEKMPKELYLIWVCMLYLSFCGNWAVFPAVMAKLFAAKNMAFNYGFIMFSVSIASIGVLVTGKLLKVIIGWHGMFFMSAGLGFIPFLLTFFFNGVDIHGNPI